MPPGSSLDPLVSPWTLVCNPEPYSVILGHYGSYLIHLEWVIEAFHYCALQCTVVHYSAILRFLRFLCFLCYFFTFFAWFGFILSYWSPTNTKITFSLLKQMNEFWHLLFPFIRRLVICIEYILNTMRYGVSSVQIGRVNQTSKGLLEGTISLVRTAKGVFLPEPLGVFWPKAPDLYEPNLVRA